MGPRLPLLLLACLALTLSPGRLRADPARMAAGTKIPALTVGATTYTDVTVRSVTARTVTITHAGGMTSIHLRDLPPEWQQRFHYDPAAATAAEQALQHASAARPSAASAPARPVSKIEQLFQQFGQPATLRSGVDLRPKYFQLELNVKNQGRRPSCAIFAIVSALEFQSAEGTGLARKFSEEYLSWATRQTAHRLALRAAGGEPDTEGGGDDADEGFTLGEVVTALRGYGIPLQSTMPNTFGRDLRAIEAPSAAIIAEARAHQRVFVFQVPGQDNPTRISNLVHALNAGVPVVIGLAWPNYRSLRNGYLNGQQPHPGSGHAVTLVGYLTTDNEPENLVFVFKNSWGVDWGQGGYGTVSYRYLSQHLGDAVLLEVLPAAVGG